jgi:hypothetical protein
MREMSAMSVKYLSQEWIDAYNAALAGDEAVHAALQGKNATLQMVISDAPQGEVRYWLRIAGALGSHPVGVPRPGQQRVDDLGRAVPRVGGRVPAGTVRRCRFPARG